MRRIFKISKALLALAILTILAYAALKLCFVLLCFFVLDHEPYEEMLGGYIPVVFGLAIGTEGYLWWRDLNRDRQLQQARRPHHEDTGLF